MIRAWVCSFFTLILFVGIIASGAGTDTELPQEPALTIFFTGNELGQLKPCGCSGGQLGGFDRRGAIFDRVPDDRRVIVDTGNLLEESDEQGLIKFEILMQAYDILGYDVLNLRQRDMNVAEDLGMLLPMQQIFGLITSVSREDVVIPESFSAEYQIDGRHFCVNVLSMDLSDGIDFELIENAPAGPTGSEQINIVLLNSDDEPDENTIRQLPASVDCAVLPPASDEPELVGRTRNGTLLITVGRLGKHVGKLTINSKADMELDYESVDVTEDVPQDPVMVQLYKTYQQLLKEADLLEKYPKLPLPDGLEYAGNESCKQCHEYEYNKWSEKAHASAFDTLIEVGSDYDPECVYCHVVGMNYESGFVSPEKSPKDLRHVGCESCHGPGSEHNESWGIKSMGQPQRDCTYCHTPEKSVEFAEKEEIYRQKIVHWREPNAPDSVEID